MNWLKLSCSFKISDLLCSLDKNIFNSRKDDCFPVDVSLLSYLPPITMLLRQGTATVNVTIPPVAYVLMNAREDEVTCAAFGFAASPDLSQVSLGYVFLRSSYVLSDKGRVGFAEPNCEQRFRSFVVLSSLRRHGCAGKEWGK